MIHLIVNPKSGNGYGEKAACEVDTLLAQRGIEHTLCRTEGPGHATELARQAVNQGAEKIAVIGGDGTLHEAAMALVGTNTALAVIAAGTGNDFIKATGIPKKPEAALDFMLSHSPKLTDTVRINGSMFLNVAGTGFDVNVLEYAEKAKKYVKGLLPYLYGVICTIFTYHPIHLELCADGGEIEHIDTLICAVGNGRFFGGGICIAPMAEIDDGMLDVTLVHHLPRHKLPQLLPGLLMGKVLNFSVTERRLVRHITLKAPHMRVQVDGEIVAMEDADIEIQPRSIWVVR